MNWKTDWKNAAQRQKNGEGKRNGVRKVNICV